MTMAATAFAAFSFAAPLTAWDLGKADGTDVGSATNCAGDDEASGSKLQALASQFADKKMRDGELAKSDREQWIKGFIAGYPRGYKDPDC